MRWISVSPSEAHAHLLSAIDVALQGIASATTSAVAAVNTNSLGGGQRPRQHHHHCQRGRQRRQKDQHPLKGDEVDAEEGEEEEEDGGADGGVVAAVACAVAGALTRVLPTSSLDSRGGGGGMGASLFPQLCALAARVVDLFLVAVTLRRRRRRRRVLLLGRDHDAVRPPVRRLDSTYSQDSPAAHVAARKPSQEKKAGADDDTVPPDLCALANALLRSVAEHLVQWHPAAEQAGAMVVVVEPPTKNVLRNAREGVAACESFQGEGGDDGGGGGGSDWDDWDDDDDDDDDDHIATERQQGASADSIIRRGAAFHGTAALMRSAVKFFEAAGAAAAAVAVAAAAARDAAETDRSTPVAKVTLSRPPSPNEGEKEEGGEQHPAKGDGGGLAQEVRSGVAEAVVVADFLVETRVEGLTPRRTTKTVAGSGGGSDHLPGVHDFPPSFVAVLDGLVPGQRRALLCAWAFDAAATASSQPQRTAREWEKAAPTAGKPSSVRGG